MQKKIISKVFNRCHRETIRDTHQLLIEISSLLGTISLVESTNNQAFLLCLVIEERFDSNCFGLSWKSAKSIEYSLSFVFSHAVK